MSEEKKEVLAVMSKVKAYIKAQGLNTSAAVGDVLTDKIKEMCDAAIAKAKNDGRKTVLERDF